MPAYIQGLEMIHALQCILQRHKRKHRRDTDTEERLPFLYKTFYKKTKKQFFFPQNGNAIRHYFPLTDYFSPQTPNGKAAPTAPTPEREQPRTESTDLPTPKQT